MSNEDCSPTGTTPSRRIWQPIGPPWSSRTATRCALIKHLDSIGDDAIAALNIPTGMPLVYDVDSTFRPVAPGGRYLDPETAAAAAEKVRDQGRLPRRGRNRLGQIDAVRQH
jgi:hypothetical protein